MKRRLTTYETAQRWGAGWLLLTLSFGCGREAAPWEPFPALPDAAPDQPDAAPPAADPQPWPEAGTAAPLPAGTGGAGPESPPPNPAAGSGAAMAGAPGAEPPSVFRITELLLRDPHLFVAGTDVTDTTVAGMSINRTVIPNQLTMDADGDGAFDVSTLLVVQPFDPRVAMGTLRVIEGKCPLRGGACTRAADSMHANWALENTQQGACLTPVSGTTGNYRTPIGLPRAPCFITTSGQNLTLSLGGTELAVTQVKLSATYQANPKQLLNGLLMGFVTDAAAMRAVLPRQAGTGLAGMPLSSFVRSTDKDNGAGPNGQSGFFIYLNFVANPVQLAE